MHIGISTQSLGQFKGFPGSSDGKESACNAGDLGLIPGWGRSPGGGHGNPLQYFCLENPMDRGAWQTTVQTVTETRLKWLSAHTHVYTVQGVCSEVHMIRSELSVSGCALSGMALFRATVLGTWESLHSSVWNIFPLSFLPSFLVDWDFMEPENPTIRIILWSLQGPSLRQKYPGENSPRNN